MDREELAEFVMFNTKRLSNCCGAYIYEDSDICSDCKEHCEAVCPHIHKDYEANFSKCEDCYDGE